MQIDLSLLSTVAECDNALDILNAEKSQLERRMRNLGEALQGRSATTISVSEGVNSTEEIIEGYRAALEVIKEEKYRRRLQLRIKREEAKLKALQNRQANYNAVSVVEDQVDHQQLEVQIPVLTAAIAEVTSRKESFN